MIILEDFSFEEQVPLNIIEKYKGIVPKQVVEVWGKYGFGSFLNGYLRIVNPDEYKDILVDSYVRHSSAIPIFTTAMGDILAWEDGYLMLLNYRKNNYNIVESEDLEFFFEDIKDENYLNKALDWQPYTEAEKKYGKLNFDECFGYVPLLGLGGHEKVGNLKTVKLIEHIYLITQFMGPIE